MYFLDDPLIFTQSDMDSSNFALDGDKRICMFDFQEVGILPESFASYTLGGNSDPFISSVARYLGWIKYHNIESMARASAVLKVSADPTLGTPATISTVTCTDVVDRTRCTWHSQASVLISYLQESLRSWVLIWWVSLC